jgi:hypothetical protein
MSCSHAFCLIQTDTFFIFNWLSINVELSRTLYWNKTKIPITFKLNTIAITIMPSKYLIMLKLNTNLVWNGKKSAKEKIKETNFFLARAGTYVWSKDVVQMESVRFTGFESFTKFKFKTFNQQIHLTLITTISFEQYMI